MRAVYSAFAIAVLCQPEAALATQGAAQAIQAKSGDLIVVENADQVRLIRRRQGQVRALFDAERRTVTVLVDYVPHAGGSPDGRVDGSLTFADVAGDWPLGARWEGPATLDDYLLIDERDNHGVGLGVTTATGLIQLLSPMRQSFFSDAAARATLSFRMAGRGGGGASFDEVERQRAVISGAPPAAASSYAGAQPVRVGGNIRTPVKLHDVRPVYPDEAMKARITGVVILEAVIGVDGTVSEARVLRSIPLLDAAALDAVKQWRFEPTMLNGVPVPVIMTVTVNFALQ